MSAPPRDLAVSVDRECLVLDGRDVKLRAQTFRVLVYLCERQGRVVTKEELFRAVWPGVFVSDDSLTKCVREIRRALGDADHQLLKTVARRGFILDAPLRAAHDERAAHNLPAPLTRFVGREREVGELRALLSSRRLVTLTGAGGRGKTRLALEVARGLLGGFEDGAWFADLAPLAEPSAVAQTVAAALEIREAPPRSLVESLADQLRHRRILLVLDNCEHVLAVASPLAETLLRAAAGLTILATSREPLGVDGETAWRVPSLAIPQAVALLTDRAAAADSTFAVTNDNAATVAEVCRRLDGIPLAIELAAARLRVLTIDQINARLDDRFRLLARADRRAGRQQTLEATVDWSYDLLAEPERLLLRRLSVFAGGWTLDAAESACAEGGAGGADVLDVLTRLVDKSLVQVETAADGHRRYGLLETVRHYARARLEQSGEADAVRARHFEVFLELSRRAAPELTAASQLLWLDRLEEEHDNLRAALEWRLTSDRPGPDALDLALPLEPFWLKRAYLAEGRHAFERALARDTEGSQARRARGLSALGGMVFFQGDFERADALLKESADLSRAMGEFSAAAVALGLQTMAAMERGDGDAAARCAEASRAAAQASGEAWLECFSLTFFAYEALAAGDVDRAGALHERGLALARAKGELWGMGIVLSDLALLRFVQNRHAEARALCREGITLGRQFGDRRAIAWFLGVLAGTDAAEGHAVRAAQLLGAMEGLLQSIGSSVQPTFNRWIGDRLSGTLQETLSGDALRQALDTGRAMSLAQAIRYAGEP